jgi:hypothetical protein
MATSKKSKLLEKAKLTTPSPNPARLSGTKHEKIGYRIVPISLYTPEANWIDDITDALKQSGSPKANRSMVVREAIHLLQESLDGRSSDEILQFFINRHKQLS